MSVKLTENHLRSLSASVYLVEKLLDEAETALRAPEQNLSTSIHWVSDLSEKEKMYALKTIQALHVQLGSIVEKYNLQKQMLSQRQFLNARISKIWEILNNSKSGSMKGFGELPDEISKSLDNDMESLLKTLKKFPG